jgi:hypothetical protein
LYRFEGRERAAGHDGVEVGEVRRAELLDEVEIEAV